MRVLLLAATLLATVPSALSQEILTLSDASAEAISTIGTPDLASARLLTVQEREQLAVATDEPIWVVPVQTTLPSLGYDLPAHLKPSEKEVGIGILLAVLISGGGQLYAGDTSKGLMILAVGIGAPIAGFIVTAAIDNAAPYLIGALVGLGAWIYGIVETPDDVRAANARNGYALAPSVTRTDGGYAAGLSLRSSF